MNKIIIFSLVCIVLGGCAPKESCIIPKESTFYTEGNATMKVKGWESVDCTPETRELQKKHEKEFHELLSKF